jgi:hypothetical protein
MADLDPFGRKKGEDPLASLGWSGSADTSAEPEVAADDGRAAEPLTGLPAEPERPPRPPREPRPRRERRPTQGAPQFRPGRAVRGLVLLAIVVAVGGSAIASLVGSGVDKAERFLEDFTTPQAAPPPASSEIPSGREPSAVDPEPATPARSAPPAIPRGVGRGSLLRPFAFGAAIKRLRNGGYGRLTNLRVAPERIDAALLTKGGALRHVQIVPGGDLRQLGSATSGFSGVPTMSLAGIDAGAPQRLTRSAAERLGVGPSRVNYLVYTQFAGTAQWNVYFTAGQIFSADAHGRITRRIS